MVLSISTDDAPPNMFSSISTVDAPPNMVSSISTVDVSRTWFRLFQQLIYHPSSLPNVISSISTVDVPSCVHFSLWPQSTWAWPGTPAAKGCLLR
jgi:hypothetical protein